MSLINDFLGESETARTVRKNIAGLAGEEDTVLLKGESGTGKELVAAILHAHSRRAHNSFVPINCPAIPPTLAESELFGHTKGAFTGAQTHEPGLFCSANGGTIFLDEIGDLPTEIQPKLLRFLDGDSNDRDVTTVGSAKSRRINVRTVAATNQNLEALIAERKFRSDLYFRISASSISLPPLRERLEDIPMLAMAFLSPKGMSLSKGTVAHLVNHRWPGNVRELKSVLSQAARIAKEAGRREILPEDISLSALKEGSLLTCVGNDADKALWDIFTNPETPLPPGFNLTKALKAFSMPFEKAVLEKALRPQWNRKRAARLVGISYRAFLYKIRTAGIPDKRTGTLARAAGASQA